MAGSHCARAPAGIGPQPEARAVQRPLDDRRGVDTRSHRTERLELERPEPLDEQLTVLERRDPGRTGWRGRLGQVVQAKQSLVDARRRRQATLLKRGRQCLDHRDRAAERGHGALCGDGVGQRPELAPAGGHDHGRVPLRPDGEHARVAFWVGAPAVRVGARQTGDDAAEDRVAHRVGGERRFDERGDDRGVGGRVQPHGPILRGPRVCVHAISHERGLLRCKA
jgi:hypothetical protein